MKPWKDPEFKAGFKFARLSTAHHSKSFYLTSRLLPRDRQWATFALYAFCRYIDNLADVPRNRSQGELLEELHQFEQELQRAYRTGESQHPVIQPYILVARQYGIPIEYPVDLIRGAQMDMEDVTYETFEDLYLFCYRVAGVVGLMMTHLLGYKDESAFEYAEKLGVAMQLTNILRDVQEDMQMGRIYLPTEELNTFGVTEADIKQQRMTPAMRQLMKYQVDRAWSYYDAAQDGIPLLERNTQFAILAASRIYSGILRKIEGRDYNPFLGRVFVPKLNKFGILFQELVRTRITTLAAT